MLHPYAGLSQYLRPSLLPPYSYKPTLVWCCLSLPQNGEFHSFVFDGPIFAQPVQIKVGRAIERDGFVYCDVLPSDYDDAAAEAEAAAADQARQELAQHKPEEVDCLELLKASNPPCPIKPSAEKQ